MEFKLNFSNEELEQLAIMGHIASHVISQSGEHSKGYKYEHLKLFESVAHKINTAFVQENSKAEFIALENLFLKVIRQYNHESLNEVICKIITERDYEEQGGAYTSPQYFLDEKYKTIYDANLAEIENNGLQRFRIVK